ncbi:hypothetical protein HanRHA438_Chr04g0198881 [Helianthus annuus]|nr:hypothetical protein HanRHA438_Chr04g0198881 [Helianthus annuus]
MLIRLTVEGESTRTSKHRAGIPTCCTGVHYLQALPSVEYLINSYNELP